jgi:hypothetical protein
MIKGMLEEKVDLHKHFLFLFVKYANKTDKRLFPTNIIEGVDVRKYKSREGIEKYLEELRDDYEDLVDTKNENEIVNFTGQNMEYFTDYVHSVTELKQKGIRPEEAEQWGNQLSMPVEWEDLSETEHNDLPQEPSPT